MPLDPNRPHRFTPLDLLAHPDRSDYWRRRRIREWTLVNPLGILPEHMPCTVCGGSGTLPLHADPDWHR